MEYALTFIGRKDSFLVIGGPVEPVMLTEWSLQLGKDTAIVVM